MDFYEPDENEMNYHKRRSLEQTKGSDFIVFIMIASAVIGIILTLIFN